MSVKWVMWFSVIMCLVIVWGTISWGGEDAAYQEAVRLFEEARKLPPDDFLGREILYRKAVTIYPEFAEAWNNLGNAYENLHQYEKARECYQRAIHINPDLAAPYLGLGDIAFTAGNYKEAKKWYTEGLLRDPGDEIARKRLQLIENLFGRGTGLITAEEIIAALSPMVTRGVGGVKAPSISFSEGHIPFDYNSAEIRPDARAQLNEIGKALSSPQLAQAVFEIAGHTCDLGSEGYNLVLSMKRAESVRDYLIRNFPIVPERLVARGYGETSPVVPNTSEENRRVNRRVEIRKIAEQVGKIETNVSDFSAQVDFFYLVGNKKVPMRQGMTLTSDDHYQIFFRVSHDCYVYIFQIDSHKRVFQLFPNPEYTPYTNPVRAGQDYWIPDKDLYFFLDEFRGEETIYFLASRVRPLDVEQAIALGLPEEVKERFILRGPGGVRPRLSEASSPVVSTNGRDCFYLVFSFYNGIIPQNEIPPTVTPPSQPQPSKPTPSPSPEPSPAPEETPSPSPEPSSAPEETPSPYNEFPPLPPGIAVFSDFSQEVPG